MKKTLTADHFFWKPTCATLGFLKGLVLLARDVSLANWGYLCRIASTHWEKFTKLIAPTSASSENARRCGAVISTILPAILSVGSVIRSGALALKVFDAVSSIRTLIVSVGLVGPRPPAHKRNPLSMLRLTARQPSSSTQTWLILPVVICLSQRLSHACLSISFYTAKLRMAH